MTALLLAAGLAWGGVLGPGAEPVEAPAEIAVEGAVNAGIYGGGPQLGVLGAVTPADRLTVGASVRWVGPTGTLSTLGARWLAVDHAARTLEVRIAAVARGVAVTRFSGRLDVLSGGVGPAVDLFVGRLGVRGSVPVGATWSDGEGTRIGAPLWDAAAVVRVGAERRGRLEGGMASALRLLSVAYGHRTEWGRWRVGLLGNGSANALSLELAWAP